MGRDFSERDDKGPAGGGGDIRVFPSRVCASRVNKQQSQCEREGGKAHVQTEVTGNLDMG